jgi:hypothetical protein
VALKDAPPFSMVEHDALRAKLEKEFNRLQITEGARDALTAELNRLAELLIETHGLCVTNASVTAE